jgi:hypothetical protein
MAFHRIKLRMCYILCFEWSGNRCVGMMNVTEEKQHRDFATAVLSALLATDPNEKVTQVRALHCTGAVRVVLLPCPRYPGATCPS